MTNYQSTIDLNGAADRIRNADRIVVTTHAKPDGDAFGSTVALGAALKQLGKTSEVWLMPPIPTQFRSLQGWPLIKTFDPHANIADADLVVILDTGAWSQLQPMRQYLEPQLDRTLIIDHHLSGNVPAAWRYIDGGAAATCEIVAQLLEVLGQGKPDGQPTDLFDETACEGLFAGLASDTGWFRFSNTRPQSLQWAARLLAKGVDHARIYQLLEQTERPEKLDLLQRALASLRYVADGSAAVMILRGRDFLETGAKLEETERFVDIPQIVGSVQLVALITEPPPSNQVASNMATSPTTLNLQDKRPASLSANATAADCAAHAAAIRLSFRSKPGPGAINVAKLAEQLGGGGHARAAGAQMNTSLEEAINRVIQEITACQEARSAESALTSAP